MTCGCISESFVSDVSIWSQRTQQSHLSETVSCAIIESSVSLSGVCDGDRNRELRVTVSNGFVIGDSTTSKRE